MRPIDAGMDMIAQAIANGTPIPKGHGILKDIDEIQLRERRMVKIKFIQCPISGYIKRNEEGCNTCPVYQAYLIGVETGM